MKVNNVLGEWLSKCYMQIFTNVIVFVKKIFGLINIRSNKLATANTASLC